MSSRLLLLVAVSAVISGCATIHPKLRVTTAGALDISRDRRLSDAAEARRDVPEDITVLQGELPLGLDLRDNKLIVQAGYESVYQMLGEVEADYVEPSQWAGIQNLYWTWNYDEAWRKAVCWPQVPLKIITLGMWNASPTEYVCWAIVPSDESDRLSEMVDGLRKAAAGMKGNLVILLGRQDATLISGNQYGVRSTTIANMALRAVVLRRDDEELKRVKDRQIPADHTQAQAPLQPVLTVEWPG